MSEFKDNTEVFDNEIRPLLEKAAAIASQHEMGIVSITCTSESDDHEAYASVYWATNPSLSENEVMRFLPIRLAHTMTKRPESLQDRLNIVQMVAVYLNVLEHVRTDNNTTQH